MRRNLAVFTMLIVMMLLLSSSPSAAQGAWTAFAKGTVNADVEQFGSTASAFLGGSSSIPEKLRVKVTKTGPDRGVHINSFVSCTSANGNTTKTRNTNKNVDVPVGKAKFVPFPVPKMGANAKCHIAIDAHSFGQNAHKLTIVVQIMSQ